MARLSLSSQNTANTENSLAEQPEVALSVVHNESESRFETKIGEEHAVADYTREGDLMTFTHTYVPKTHEGQGIGQALARAALDFAVREKLTVVPACPFIAAFVERNAEYQALLRGF